VRFIAMDTEGENNLHAYGETLALVQIYDGENKVIIDPLNIDTHCLKMLFENRDILKIMYDAAGDSSLLKNACNIEMKSVLDLRPAADLLDMEKRDLHSVINAELGVALNSKTRFQRHNWMTRPIAPEALEYAINDVTYLFRLKDALLKRLFKENQLEMFILRNVQVQNKDYYRNPDDKYRRIKGFHALSDDEKTVFKQLFEIREKYARQYNLPAFNIVNNADLLELARDAGYIHNIRFSNRLRDSLVQSLREDLVRVGR
jgi:ribonuclease D